MLETSTAIAMAPVHGAVLSPPPVSRPRVITLGIQHLPCFAEMTSEAFKTTNQRAFQNTTAKSALMNTLRYTKAINTEGRDRYPVVDASESVPNVVGGNAHFMSAYRRYFDSPESNLFPTDYSSSPSKAAAAAAAQRGGGALDSPSQGLSHALGPPPPTFQSTQSDTHKDFPPEFLYQHPLRTFTTSSHTMMTQDRCYRIARAEGLPVPQDCVLGDKFAYIRDGTGGYIVADTKVDPAAYTSSKDPSQQHDHMFGALQVVEEKGASLGWGNSSGNVVPRYAQNLPPVGSGFVTTHSASFNDPNVGLANLNEIAQQRTAAFILDGSITRKREVPYTLPGIFHRINGVPTIVREKEVMYQMRVANGRIRSPPRAKITSISLEHEPLSVPVQRQ